MEGMSRKKSVDVSKLPEVPQLPQELPVPSPSKKNSSKHENDLFFGPLFGFKDREASFYKTLSENIKIFDSESKSGSDTSRSADMSGDVKITCEEECREYITPLMNHTQGSISNLLAIKDSLDQLDSLHRIIQQLLTVQEQNYQMRKRLRTVKTLHVLKEMEIQMNTDPEKFIKNSMEDGSDLEIDVEFEQNIADLEAVLAASKSASNKRNNSKKQRSKSIMSDDIAFSSKENYRNYPLRRQSAISDFKPKVSKWKAVKAAFKWEKANTLTLNESKSSDSVLSPSPNENTKYFLRVPSTPMAMACSSGDSLFSTSSGRNFATSGGASGQSSGDENDETLTKSKSFIRAPSFHDDDRRSHSLDGDLTYGSNSLQHSPSEKSKNSKSAWSKVKGIVINRNSRKSLKSSSSVNSRDVSPIDLLNEMQRDRSEDSISSPIQPSSPCILGLPEVDLCPTSDESECRNDLRKTVRSVKRSSKKGKLIPEIESLPEGVPLVSKPLPSPLTLKRDCSESDGYETFTKFMHRKYSISDPNSPQKNQEFFSENDFSSGADNSEPLSPLRRGGSNNSSRSSWQHNEILKNYEELQKKIAQEFYNKQQEWSRVRPLVVQLNSSVPPYIKEDSSLPSTPKNAIENLLLNEENLTADFKRKLDEWRTKKSQQSIKENSKKQQQSPDWNAWKTGQMKFENQGLIAFPDAKNLPEDFQKKLNEWKQMKAEGKSPPYSTQSSVQEKFKRQFSKSDSKSSESGSFKKSKTIDEKSEISSKVKAINPPCDEIVVKTSEGLLKFKGISKSFTMKLYEWEKAKGIAPESESSAFAFLHPKYQQLIDENGNIDESDKGSGMKRAMSVDSIKPVSSSAQMSHQPSSLSLNDADNLKETDNTKVSSTPAIQIFCSEKTNIQPKISIDEPEAVIVEVEDDGMECIPVSTETTPLQIQIPVFKFDFANKDTNQDLKMDVNKTFTEIKSSLNNIEYYLNENSGSLGSEKLKNLSDKFYNIRQLLKHLRVSLEGHELDLSIQSTCDFLIMLENSSPSHKFSQLLIEKFADLKKLSHGFLPHEPSTSEYQATSSIQLPEDDKAVATVKITPTFMCNTCSVKIDEQISKPTQLKVTSESEIPEMSTEDMKSDEKSNKRVVRNTSNTSKRKIRLRRMGSRQNSKTESDSDEEFVQNPETQRKAKRKTSRAKKQLESDKSFDSFQGEEEVVYVFKIKPGETNEVIVKANDQKADIKQDDSILISPTENCVELIDAHEFTSQTQSSFAIPIVKTKRKIFTPVDENNCTNMACISHDIESSSSSEKTVDKGESEVPLNQAESIEDKAENKVPIEKPQAPEKPPRKHEFTKQGSNKDLSPSIRRMIDIYTYNIEDKAISKSGSSSPLWLSPILARRVRKQSAEYQDKIAKSSSAGNIPQEEVSIKDDKCQTDTEVVCDIRIEEIKPIEVVQIEEPIVVKEAFQISTGAIPKRPKVQVDSIVESDIVQLRENKPKTPLSERAQKIRQAKEAFFKSPTTPTSSLETENYRLSLISIGSTSTISNSVENISSSASMLQTNNEFTDKVSIDSVAKTSSLPRNIQNSDGSQISPKSSKFGLSSIATKLRKVKLKKASKEAGKMNTIPVLCRQSLNVDLFNESALSEPQASPKPEKSQSAFRFKKNKNDTVKKSKSLGLL